MGALRPARRKASARELAEKYGVSPRTVQRDMAEPRAEFLGRAAARRAQAVQLRQEGMKYTEIAEAMGCSIGTVSRLLHDAKKHGEWPSIEHQDSA